MGGAPPRHNGPENNSEWLRARAREGLMVREIAKLAGCCDTTIKNRMREMGIQGNTRLTKKRGLWLDTDWLRQRRIVDHMSCTAMAKLAGCAYSTILYELKRQGVYDGHITHRPKQPPTEKVVGTASPEIHLHHWWERDNEREVRIFDCLDCDPDTVTSCVGCVNDR